MGKRMSEDSYNRMNHLAALCFDANAVVDNLAYNLDYNYYGEIAKIVHLNVAHVMPEWADLITDKMIELSMRPIREDIDGHTEEYNDLKSVFNKLLETLNGMRTFTMSLIDSADMKGDAEVRIFAEAFLSDHLSAYIKQAEEWLDAANKLTPHEMNVHIKEYTHFIAC